MIDKIEAWYWAAIFSGEYDKDQNERYEKNLRSMLESLHSSKSDRFDWIKTMRNNVLNVAYFSDKSFLLMEKSNEDRIPKEHLGKYFCQFYLSKPYCDLVDDTERVHVFRDKLEKHHIVPLGSVKSVNESSEKLRSDKAHICNSPLNFVYITDKTNKAISDDSLDIYESKITASAKAQLHILSFPAASELDDLEKTKKWLDERHKTIRGEIQNRIDLCIVS